MLVVPRWKDASGIVHEVREWVTWRIQLFDEPDEASPDEGDPAEYPTWESACGTRLEADDLHFEFRDQPVTCLRCLAQDEE